MVPVVEVIAAQMARTAPSTGKEDTEAPRVVPRAGPVSVPVPVRDRWVLVDRRQDLLI